MDLTNHFLLAMPHWVDDTFSGSLIYLCEYSERGAMGLVVNKPSMVSMDVVFQAVNKRIPLRFHGQFVLIGGPSQPERGFVLHMPVGDWQSSLVITDTIALTTSRDVIEGLTDDKKIPQALLTIGYSSWDAGQLEKEIAQNHWLVLPANPQILFDIPPEERYVAALNQLGITPDRLTGAWGHA